MTSIVYGLIIIVPLIFLLFFWVKFNIHMLKYKFIYVLDSPKFNKKNLENIKEKAPVFYGVLAPIYNLSTSGITFTDFKDNSKKLDEKSISTMKKEIELLEDNKDTKNIIQWYKDLCMFMYFYEHPIIYSILMLVVSVKIKVIEKQKVNKKIEDDSIGLSY